MTLPHQPRTTPRKTSRLAFAALAAALTLLVPTSSAQTEVLPPPQDIDVTELLTADLSTILAYVMGVVHVTGCPGTGASADYAGNGAEVCVMPGPNGGTCGRVRSFTPGGDVTADYACVDADAGGRPCASAYHFGGLDTDDRTCVGSYPDGFLCVSNAAHMGYLEDRVCGASDAHGNPCVSDGVYNYGSLLAQARVCAGDYPGDGLCAPAVRTYTAGTTAEGRTCVTSDPYGNPCVGEVAYVDGGFVAADHVCAGDYGSDGTCAANRAAAAPGRDPDSDTRACVVFDGGDPCVQGVSYFGGSELARDRACLRPDGAGPTEPCATNDVRLLGGPVTGQGACVDRTGGTCLVAWLDLMVLLPGRYPFGGCI